MPKNQRAILRGVDGEFLQHLEADQAEVYEVYAERGKVHRSVSRYKGRSIIIFRLKEKCLPDVEPSETKPSHCSLTRSDMELLVVRREVKLPRRLIERWMGHGLIPTPAL